MAAKSKPTDGMMDPTSFQLQMKQNNMELQDYMKDLGQWEDEIKKKESFLLKQKPILKQSVPPVRGKKGEDKKVKSKGASVKRENSSSQRIKSFDYKSWDKFDVDKACADCGSEEDEEELESFGEEEEEVSNVQIEEVKGYKRMQKASLEKEKGNDLYKEGKYEAAIEHYTSGVQLDPSSAVLVSNRAMALLKMERYAAAEKDCTTALELDSAYTKAFFRRGTARKFLKNYRGALEDFRKVLELDKKNTQAAEELGKVEKLLKECELKDEMTGPYVKAVKRPENLRSKKPLKRVTIEEVGVTAGEEMGVSSRGEKDDLNASNVKTDSARLNNQNVDSERHLVPKVTEIVTEGDNSHEEEGLSGEEGKGEFNRKRKVLIEEMVTSEETLSHENRKPDSTSDRQDVVFASEGQSTSENPSRLQTLRPVHPVPSTAYQFSASWKSLQGSRKEQYQFLTQIPSQQYKTVLKQLLETSVFGDILSIFRDFYIKQGRSCLHELQGLSQVSRFSVAVMFLSSSDKSVLEDIFSHLESVHKEDLDAITKTRRMFGL